MSQVEHIDGPDIDRAREYAEKQDWRGLDQYLWDMSQTRQRGIPISFAIADRIACEYSGYDRTAWCDGRCAAVEAVAGKPCANWRPGVTAANKEKVAKGPLFGGDVAKQAQAGVTEIPAGVPF